MTGLLHQLRPFTLQVSFKEHVADDSRFICWLALATETHCFIIDALYLRQALRAQTASRGAANAFLNFQYLANPRVLKLVPRGLDLTALQRDL